jgi:hypothetical protein
MSRLGSINSVAVSPVPEIAWAGATHRPIDQSSGAGTIGIIARWSTPISFRLERGPVSSWLLEDRKWPRHG